MSSQSTLRPGDVTVESRSQRRSLLLGNAHELMIAAAGVLSCICFIVWPSSLEGISAYKLGQSFAIEWAVLWGGGCLLTLHGLVCIHERAEIVGQLFIALAGVVNAITLLQVKGFPGPGLYVALTFLGFAVAAGMRIYLLLRLRRAELGLRRRD